MFFEVHDLNDGLRSMINTDDVSRIEERAVGCVIYFKTTADDFDKTRHQVSLAVAEDYSHLKKTIE